ncbi:MAG: hypothetical protein WDN69_30880 [Aliidongia sp.]
MPISSASSARSEGVGSPLDAAVVERARRGETDCPGAHRLLGQVPHPSDIVGRGRFKLRAALAHDEDAQRAMRQLGTEIDIARPCFERVEIGREALPVPGQTLMQRRAPECPRRLP